MKAPAFQLYAREFLADTMNLTDAETGLFMRLLCVQWLEGGLPNDEDTLRGYSRGRTSLVKVKTKFKVGGDGLLRNERLEEIRSAQMAYKEKRSQSGKTGANTRWNHGTAIDLPSKTDGTAKVLPSPPDGTAISLPMANDSSASSSASSSANNTPLPPPLEGEEKAVEAAPTTTPPPDAPPKVKPKGPLQLRAEKLMRRRESTPLTAAEDRAFKKNAPCIKATSEDDWQALEAFYAAPQPETYARKDLAALVNNWNGEIDRAKAWLANPRGIAGPEPKSLLQKMAEAL